MAAKVATYLTSGTFPEMAHQVELQPPEEDEQVACKRRVACYRAGQAKVEVKLK